MKLYDLSSVLGLLGCIANDTSLILNNNYKLDKYDFVDKYDKTEGSNYHYLLFEAFKRLASNGTLEINEFILGEFISNYPAKEEIFKDNNYLEMLNSIKGLANPSNYSLWYSNVRKFSCLRDYKNEGFDISPIYDIEKDEAEERAKLDGMSIEDIINHFKKIQFQIEKKFTMIKDETEMKRAGDNAEEIYYSFKKNPIFGLSFESKYLTTLWGGFRKQQLYMRSGDTSSGKSRGCISDLATVCVSEIYDIENNEWIKNPNGKHRGCYIGAEMTLDEEIEPILWAYVSGVDSAKIIHGTCNEEEEKRVKKAYQVINEDCMWLIDMPSFTQQKIEEKIRELKIKFNIEYLAFDYAMLNSELVREFVNSRGGVSGGAREDQILNDFVKFLKNMCKKYDIGIITGSQVNTDIKDYRNRDYQVLRGGKSMADLLTGGSISMPITTQEFELIKPFIESRGFNNLEPNFIETVYKSRQGEYPKECKIFSYYNLGNMRRTELFTTTKDFQPINIKKTIIIEEDENND